jgi:DNA-binding response OmpR family regulator
MYKELKSITILLAEDEKELSTLMKDAIGEYFKEFIVVDNGEKALLAYKKYKPHIVISDILMPKLNGLELLKKLREENEKLPIILLSAYSDTSKLLQAIDNGVSKYFIKPLDPDELLEYLVTLIPKLETIHIVELGNNFSYNKAKKQLLNNKSIISLTKRELDFILLLLEQDEYLADNQLIKKALWKEENIPNERVRTFIRRLRNKTSKEFIINNSSLGYSLSLPL